MHSPLRVVLTAAVAAVLVLPAPGLAGPGKGKGAAKGPPKDCETTTFSYDSAGEPRTEAPSDPLFTRQWGLDQINAPEAWAQDARGEGVTIAIIDTGVDFNHPDLAAKLVPGFDFVAGKRDCPPGPQDENGHGTHVAGIAAAITDNGVGVAGTAPEANIMPVRVLDEDGSGTIDDVAAGIRWAADNGAEVVNLSLGELPIIGQLEPINEEIESAIDYAWDEGAVVVAAAGNDTFPLCSYPSFAKRSVCVGATDSRGAPTFYSNFPNKPEVMGVRAPGGVGSVLCEHDEDIWSTIWPGSGYDCQGSATVSGRTFTSGYETLAGTSMAAPFVSGVAALLFGQGLTNEQVVERLRTTSSNNGVYDPVMGYGIVDAEAATAPQQ